MKKIFKTVLILCVFILASTSAFANCYTGFACSIKDLNNNSQQTKEYIDNINHYFNKTVNENLYFGKLSSNINYNDMFIFNTIV